MQSCTIVIFGATGDLSKKKLLQLLVYSSKKKTSVVNLKLNLFRTLDATLEVSSINVK